MATYAQRLVLVQQTIDDVLATGQSGRYGDRTWTKANLVELQKLETDYRALAAMEARATSQGGRLGVTYVTPR